MFDASMGELILVFVIGLLILGPERLPRVAAQIGRWVAKARRTANQFRYQLEREIALEEMYKAQKKKPQQPASNRTGTEAPVASKPSDTTASEPSSAPEASSSAGEGSAPSSDDASDAAEARSAESSAPLAAMKRAEEAAGHRADDGGHPVDSPRDVEPLEAAESAVVEAPKVRESSAR